MTSTQNTHILGLDLGAARVGVALASTKALIPKSLITLTNDAKLSAKLKEIIDENHVETIVVGLPRSLDGQNTQQTTKIKDQIADLATKLNINIVTQDEALSSQRAETELVSRGKIFAKADIDKLAACLILEDYILSLNT